MESDKMESEKKCSKECSVSFKSGPSKVYKYFKKKRSSRVLRKFLFSGITSCLSVRRKDSQGCTADVKDTPPSPKQKPDDLIGPDIDPVGDHDDLMATGSMKSFDSGVSLKSDRSRNHLILFKDRVSLSRLDLSSFEKKHDVADDEDLVKSFDDLRALENMKSFDSGLSFKSDQSRNRPIRTRYYSFPGGRNEPGALV